MTAPLIFQIHMPERKWSIIQLLQVLGDLQPFRVQVPAIANMDLFPFQQLQQENRRQPRLPIEAQYRPPACAKPGK